MTDYEKTIGKPAMLEQLAEECAELAQAALKFSRVLRGENPTPVSKEEAEKNLIEEYTDVYQVAKWIDLRVDPRQMAAKKVRFEKRVSSRDKELGGDR